MSQPNFFLNSNKEIDYKMLEEHFLSNAINEFVSNCLNNKIIDILNFRIKYNCIYEFPERLFFYDSRIDYNVKKSIANIKACKLESHSISYFLKKDFPNINCIIDFFCYSTFPSMFGHFTSQECIENAFHFIQKNINDIDISPFLICSFFLHSTVFQDRLMTIFYTNFISEFKKKNQDDQEFSNDLTIDFKAIFIDSFCNCLAYLSECHLNIIKEFKQKYPRLAIFTLSIIIKSLIKLWNYCPFFENFNILNKPKFIADCMLHQNYIFNDIAKSIKKSIQTKDIETILALFDEYPYFHVYAKYETAIYKKTLTFIFSDSDIEVIQKIAESLQSDKIEKSDMTIEEFIRNSMNIIEGEGHRDHYDNKLIKKLNEMSSQEFHTELTKISSSLPELHFCTVHSSRILKLKLFQYAEKVVFKTNHNSSHEFGKGQLISYALNSYKECFEGKNIDFKSDIDIIIQNISLIFSERIANKDNREQKGNIYVGRKIIEYVYNKANMVIQEDNKKNPGGSYVLLSNETNIKNIPAFVSAVDDIAWYLLLLRLSSQKVDIILNDEIKIEINNENRLDVLKFLRLHTNKYINNDQTRNRLEDVTTLFKNFSEVSSMIDISNQQMKTEFDQGNGMYNFGKKIRTFIKIYDSINKSINKTKLIFGVNQKYVYYFLYTSFYNKKIVWPNMDSNSKEDENENDEVLLHLAYFKLNLIISVRIMEKIFSSIKELQYLPMRFFDAEKKLKILLKFFNMKENVNPNESLLQISINGFD